MAAKTTVRYEPFKYVPGGSNPSTATNNTKAAAAPSKSGSDFWNQQAAPTAQAAASTKTGTPDFGANVPSWQQATAMAQQQLASSVAMGRDTAREQAQYQMQRDSQQQAHERSLTMMKANTGTTQTQQMQLDTQKNLMSMAPTASHSSKNVKQSGPTMQERQFDLQRQQSQQQNQLQRGQMEQDRQMQHNQLHHQQAQTNATRNVTAQGDAANRASQERIAGMNAAAQTQSAMYSALGNFSAGGGGDMNWRYW